MKNAILKLKYSLIFCVIGLITLSGNYFINTSEVQFIYLNSWLIITSVILFITAFILILIAVYQLKNNAETDNIVIPSKSSASNIPQDDTNFSLLKHLTTFVPGVIYKFQFYNRNLWIYCWRSLFRRWFALRKNSSWRF